MRLRGVLQQVVTQASRASNEEAGQADKPSEDAAGSNEEAAAGTAGAEGTGADDTGAGSTTAVDDAASRGEGGDIDSSAHGVVGGAGTTDGGTTSRGYHSDDDEMAPVGDWRPQGPSSPVAAPPAAMADQGEAATPANAGNGMSEESRARMRAFDESPASGRQGVVTSPIHIPSPQSPHPRFTDSSPRVGSRRQPQW